MHAGVGATTPCRPIVSAWSTAALIAVAAFGHAPFVEAQTENNRSSEVSGKVLEEVVVTSRRREEGLQRVPISVAAFQSGELELRNVADLLDLDSLIPNVSIAGAGAAGNTIGSFHIRGIGTSRSDITVEPGVAVYLDGVFLGQTDGALLDVIAPRRIEVLRGPQGTLFGKNALGGAIRYISEEPAAEFGGKASLTYGRFDRVDLSASVDIPLSDEVYSKVTAALLNRDGYGESVLTGREFGDIETRFAKVDLLWGPTPSFEARISADYTAYDNNGPARTLLNVNPDAIFVRLLGMGGFIVDDSLVTDSVFTNRSTADTHFEQDLWGVHLTASWDALEWLTLESITAYREFTFDRFSDFDGIEFVLFEQQERREHEQFSQELRLHGRNFEGRLDWVTGLYYFTEEPFSDRRRFNVPEIGFPPRDQVFREDTTSVALFGEGTVKATNLLSVTLGARFTRENKETFASDDTNRGGGPVSGANEEDFNEFTPRLALEAQWSDNLMAFFSYSTGFRSGGFNNRFVPTLPDNGFLPFEEETLESIEVGIRSEWLDSRLRLNVTYFHGLYDDIQLASTVGGQTFTANVGEGEMDGVELDGIWLAGEGLSVNFSIGWLDARYTELGAVTEVTLDSEFPRAPEWSYSVGAQYERLLPENRGTLVLRADWGWQDDQRTAAGDNLALIQESYGLLGGRIQYETLGGRWNVALFGKNLTDEEYLISGLANAGAFVDFGVPGRPREWGVRLDLNY